MKLLVCCPGPALRLIVLLYYGHVYKSSICCQENKINNVYLIYGL